MWGLHPVRLGIQIAAVESCVGYVFIQLQEAYVLTASSEHC